MTPRAPAASTVACVDLARSTAAVCNMLCTFTHIVACSSAMMQAYRVHCRGKLVVAESSERTADSRKPRRCLSSFRNAQWNQWLSLKEQVQPVLCCVLACGRSMRFRQGQKQPVCRLCRKALVYKVGTASRLMKHLSGAHAIQWQAHQIKE